MIRTISNNVFGTIQRAVYKGNLDEVIKIYADNNLHYNSRASSDREYYQDTVLHRAAEYEKLDIVQYLVELGGADVNIVNKDGNTPLHRAVSSGHKDIVKYLVESGGADVNIVNKDGNTPLHWAVDMGHKDIVQYLLHWSVVGGHLAELMCLLEAGADVNIMDNSGSTLLHVAVEARNIYVVRCLLDAGVDVTIRNKEDKTPLQTAADLGQTDAVRFILRVLPPKGYVELIRVFVEDKLSQNQSSILKSIYIAILAKVNCDESKRNTLKKDLGDLYIQFSDKIKSLSSWNVNEREDLHLIALKIYNCFLKESSSCMKLTCTCCDCEWLPHRCKARGRLALVLCIMGVVSYVLDLYSDIVVGIDDYNGFSKKLGILEIFLVVFTLLHENIRSASSLYKTEEELLGIKLGRLKLKIEDWKNSDLHYHDNIFVRWMFMILWPFKVDNNKTGKWKKLKALKPLLFNILTLSMLRPIVDRLIVLVHAPSSLYNYYRYQAEQNALKQFYLILEQLPELMIQFYTVQIVLNNIFPSPEAHLSCNQVFAYDKVFNETNSICGRFNLPFKSLFHCSTAFRIFSMSIPFFNIPSGILSLESGFRALDALTPKMSTMVKILVQVSYTLMIPARIFLFATIMHAFSEKYYAIYYIVFRALVELLINLFYHKAAGRYLRGDHIDKKTASYWTDTKKCWSTFWTNIRQMLICRSIVRLLQGTVFAMRYIFAMTRLGYIWRLIMFAIRDVFAISLRNPEAYMNKPSEVSYESLRHWHSLALRSLPFICEGFVGALYIEYYYPCGKESNIFKYLGWFCLVGLTFSLTLLVLLSDLLHPPRTKALPSIFLKKSLVTSSIGLATCGIAAVAFFFSKTRNTTEQWVVIGIMIFYLVFFGGVIVMLYCDTKDKTKKCEHRKLSKDKTKKTACHLLCCPWTNKGLPENDENYDKKHHSTCCTLMCCPRAQEENSADSRDVSNDNGNETSETCCLPFCRSCPSAYKYNKLSSTNNNPPPDDQTSKQQNFLSKAICFKAKSTNDNEDIELSDPEKKGSKIEESGSAEDELCAGSVEGDNKDKDKDIEDSVEESYIDNNTTWLREVLLRWQEYGYVLVQEADLFLPS